MRNTNGNYKIVKKNLFNKFILIGGISVSSFFINNFFHANTIEDLESHYVIQLDGDIAFGDQSYADQLYQRAVEDLKNKSYDKVFVDICRNPKFVVDGVEYKAKDFYIRMLEDGTVYFSNLRDKYVNLFTGEKLSGEIINTESVYKSSIFYQMYLDGILTKDGPIEVNKEVYQMYADNWDGKIHDQTFDNDVSLKMNEYINNAGNSMGR